MIMGSDKSHPKNYRLIPEKKCGAMRSNIIRYVFLKDAQSSKDTILDLALLYQGVISESSILISSASIRSITFLSFIVPIFA